MTRPDQPLVTFALFAYNQERYIREAVEGAFSQTYEPLEIILSDDCSQDRTFEIMQEMATGYKGPHRVRIIRNPQNMGLVPHVLARGREAKGEIVVVAAGDDVSLPERTAKHVHEYSDPSVWGVSGGFHLVDEDGAVIASDQTRPIGLSHRLPPQNYFARLDHGYQVIQGSTASYCKKVFDIKLPSWRILFSEDNLFNFTIYVSGHRVAFINESLILYRSHPQALSNSRRKKSAAEFEIASWKSSSIHINKMDTFAWIAARYDTPEIVDSVVIERLKWNALQIENWPRYGIFTRLASIFHDALFGPRTMLKWKIGRSLGRFPRYQPKMFLEYIRGAVKK